MNVCDEILNDFAASYWLKNAVRELSDRDPVDALADAEALADAMRDRLEKLQEGGGW